MTIESKPFASKAVKSSWLAIGKFLLLAAFIVAVYLLGASMVHHRFFRGGRIDQRGVLTP
jgi:hypothetical protein